MIKSHGGLHNDVSHIPNTNNHEISMCFEGINGGGGGGGGFPFILIYVLL